jgi:hypothetical protein
VKDLPAEGKLEHHNEAQTEKRLKIYRESNPSLTDPKHQINFF